MIENKIKAVCRVMIISLIINILPMLSFAAEDTEDISSKLRLLESLNIIEKGEIYDINYDETITRAEFSQKVAKLLNMTDVAVDTEALSFRDIDENHPYYKAVYVLYQKGIVSGKSKYVFAPDEMLTSEEAVTILVSALGYEVTAESMGGYPIGYFEIARNIELIKTGSDMTSGDFTKKKMVKLLYDSLLSYPVSQNIKVDGYSLVQGEKTLLEDVYEMTRIEGMIEETSKSSLRGAGTIRDNEIKIAGKVYQTGDADIKNYLGYNVIAYIENYEEQDEEKVFLYEIDERENNIITIAAEDILDATRERITYAVDDKKEKYIKISSVVDVVYNGVGKAGYTEADFKPVLGKITFNDTDGDDVADIMLIDDYKLAVAETVINSKTNFTLIDRRGVNNITISLTDNDIITEIYKNGKLSTTADIANSDVVFIQDTGSLCDKRYITIYSSSAKKIGILTQIGEDYIVIEGEEIPSNNLYDTATASGFLKRDVNVYLDPDGKVAYISANADKRYGYLYRCFENEENERIMAKILTEDNEYKTYYLAEKVRNNSERFEDTEILNTVASGGVTDMQLIRYKLNQNEEITDFDTALIPTDEDAEKELLEDGKFFSSGSKKKRLFLQRSYTMLRDFHSANWIDFFLPDDLKIIVRPEGAISSQEDIVFTTRAYLKDLNSYVVQGYNREENNNIGALVIYGEFSTSVVRDQTFVVVDEILEELNEDDEIVEKLAVYERGEYKVYETKESGLLQYNGVPLKKGDITRIITDLENKIIALEPNGLKFSLTGDITQYYTDSEDAGSDATAAFAYYRFAIGTVADIKGDMLKIRVKDGSVDNKPKYLIVKMRSDTKYVMYDGDAKGGLLAPATKADLEIGAVVLARDHWSTLYDVVIYKL